MSSGSGGGGRSGRSGGSGGATYGPGGDYPLGGSQPLSGDTNLTVAIRKSYGDGKKGVNVAVEQLRGGVTRATHPMGEITMSREGATVVGRNGKRYNYSQKNTIKAITHWERLGGIK